MFGPFGDLTTLLAQAAGGEGTSSTLVLLLTFLPVAFFYYVLIWRPAQTQEKKRREMVDALKKNDKVLTQAGIYGTVVSVSSEGDRVVLRVDDDRGVKLEFSKTAVIRVLDGSTEKADKT
jgi:preprotein translocase subunit YajC